MSARNEDTLVRECNQTSDGITEMLIELQDNSYNLGFRRGQLTALESIEWTSAKGFTFCPSCNHTEQAGHSPGCVIGNAIRKARGEA